MNRYPEIISSTPVRHAKPKVRQILEINNISVVTIPKKSTYLQMICVAIANIGLPNTGASFTAIKKWVLGKHEGVDSKIQIRSLKRAVLKGISDGVLLRPKKDIHCKGAQGSFLLSQPELKSKKPSTAKNALAGTREKTKATKAIPQKKTTNSIPETKTTNNIPKTKATKQKTQNGLTREQSSGKNNGEAPIRTPKKTRLNKIKKVINKRTSITPVRKIQEPRNQANNKQKKIGNLKKNQNAEIFENHFNDSGKLHSDDEIEPEKVQKLGSKKNKKPQNKIDKAQHSLSVSSISDAEIFENLQIKDANLKTKNIKRKLVLKKGKKPQNKIDKAQHSLSVSSLSGTEIFENLGANVNGKPHSDVDFESEEVNKTKPGKSKKGSKLQTASVNNEPTIDQPGKSKPDSTKPSTRRRKQVFSE